MKTQKSPFASALLTLAVALTSLAGSVAWAGSASPFLKLGPKAIPTAAGPNYGLFTCQVVGVSPTQTCYDPYQIRHA